MFCVNDKLIALCGRHNVHVYPANALQSVAMAPLSLTMREHLPEGTTPHPEKLCAVCVDISKNGQFVLTADSGKNVFIFEYVDQTWELFSSFQMEKRIVKAQFDSNDTHVVLTDKTGDVYVSYKGPKTMTGPKKILGHTSYVLDVLITADNSKIITCDRDEKIRISHFPAAFDIVGYKLGHKEPVVNAALVSNDNKIVSISAEGTLKLWSLAENKPLKTWNIFNVMKTEREQHNEVVKMRVCDSHSKVYLTLLISGLSDLPVFEMKKTEQTIRLFGRARLDNDLSDFRWHRDCMYVFCPDNGTLKKYNVGSGGGLVLEEKFGLPHVTDAKEDWALFAKFNRPSLPAKKRVPSEVVSRVEQTREALLEAYGPLPTEESSVVQTSAYGTVMTERMFQEAFLRHQEEIEADTELVDHFNNV